MKFFKSLKTKIQALLLKLGGAKNNIPEFVAINIYYNNEIIATYESTSTKLKTYICDIIKEFAKNNDYTILYDYPGRMINITFNVKTKK